MVHSSADTFSGALQQLCWKTLPNITNDGRIKIRSSMWLSPLSHNHC